MTCFGLNDPKTNYENTKAMPNSFSYAEPNRKIGLEMHAFSVAHFVVCYRNENMGIVCGGAAVCF